MNTIRVGYTLENYQYRKNVRGYAPDCDYVLCRDFFSALWRGTEIIKKIPGLSPAFSENNIFKFQDFGWNDVDLIHLYNGVSFAKRPWISTFETTLPRYPSIVSRRYKDPEMVRRDPSVRHAIKALARESCRYLLVNAQNSVAIQSEFLNLFPAEKALILPKIHILEPPQQVDEDIETRQKRWANFDRPIRFMFVGNYFFLKGGREILLAMKELRKKFDWPLELEIVSSLTPDSYATGTTELDISLFMKFITDNKSWIKYSKNINNREVMALMDFADVGLLPSYADTYGFAVLEFQSKGIPVITTDIRCFPEINPPEVGWQIGIPQNEVGIGLHEQESRRSEIFEAIYKGLCKVIESIMTNPEEIKIRGLAARDRIIKVHAPEKFGHKLRLFYENAINGKMQT